MASYFPHNHSCSQDQITCLISAAVRAVEFLRRIQGGKMSIFSELHLPSLTSERRVVQISKKVLEHLPVGSQQAKVMGSIHVRSSLWVFILWVWGSGPVSERVYCNVSPICVKATVSNNQSRVIGAKYPWKLVLLYLVPERPDSCVHPTKRTGHLAQGHSGLGRDGKMVLSETAQQNMSFKLNKAMKAFVRKSQ